MEINKKELEEIFTKLFYNNIDTNKRRLTIYTDSAGMDNFNESFEGNMGLRRLYLGYKVPRILRYLRGRIKKSHTKGYYKLIKV